MRELTELLKRVETATGPDRDLDRGILDALGIVVREFDPGDGDVSQWREWSDGTKIADTHITASIDAAFSLVERVLPGQHLTLGQNVHHHYWLCTFNELDESGAVHSNASSHAAPTPALAILSALLRSRQSQKE